MVCFEGVREHLLCVYGRTHALFTLAFLVVVTWLDDSVHKALIFFPNHVRRAQPQLLQMSLQLSLLASIVCFSDETGDFIVHGSSRYLYLTMNQTLDHLVNTVQGAHHSLTVLSKQNISRSEKCVHLLDEK